MGNEKKQKKKRKSKKINMWKKNKTNTKKIYVRKAKYLSSRFKILFNNSTL